MSNPSYSRMRRVNSVIREVVADEVERLKDPRLGLVSITAVETAPNLREATVFFSTLDLAAAEETGKALQAAAPRLRRAVGSQVRLKYTPALSFELDRGIVEGERIDAILKAMERSPDDDE